jgi:WD40 repeat protein
MEVRTGPLGPVLFVTVLALLQACTPLAMQAPDIDLAAVHESGAHRIDFDPGGRLLASGGYRGDVAVWSLVDGKRVVSIEAHGTRITGLHWLDEQGLLSTDRAGEVSVHDPGSGRLLFQTRLDGVINTAIAPDRSWLAILTDTAVLRLGLPSLTVVQTRALSARPISVAVDAAGQRIAISTEDGEVWLLDATLSVQSRLPAPSTDANDLVFSPDGQSLLAGGWFRLLHWNLVSGALHEYPTEHLGKVNSVDISPDGHQWISLGRDTDSRFQLYDARTHAVSRRFQVHGLCGQRARFGPNGRYVASSSDDGSIHIYDLTTPYAPTVYYPDNE